jgi:DNA-binding transcriptional ArsR family regulator
MALVYENDFAPAAALLADPTRAAILRALLPGRPLAAGELARVAGVGAATASHHLAKLLGGGMVAVAQQARHRYYQLAGHEVAAALEAIGLISPMVPARSLRQSREARAHAEARTCYDHLAGRAGVELLDALLREGLLAGGLNSGELNSGEPAASHFELTRSGRKKLCSFGIDIEEIRRSRRQFAGACMDWTQRRHHLNGALAAAITGRMFTLGWIERGTRRRSVVVTERGVRGLAEMCGWSYLAQE